MGKVKFDFVAIYVHFPSSLSPSVAISRVLSPQDLLTLRLDSPENILADKI